MTKSTVFDEMSDQLWDAELRELEDLRVNYDYLYVEDPERADRLRKGRWGGFFWNCVRGWMISEIILSISRLTDPPEMGKRRTLTLRALLDDPRLPDQLKCELGCELKSLRNAVKKIRRHRNRMVAHRDRRTALGEDTLPPLQVRQIADIVARLQDVHRKHRAACMGISVSEYGTHTLRGVERLIASLEQSDRARLIFAKAERSDEDKLRDWAAARRIFFPTGA